MKKVSMWDRAAVMALAYDSVFCWIESHQQATENDVYFY